MAATNGPQFVMSFTAGAAISSAYTWVKLTADRTVQACAATTDKPIGVIQNTAASGGIADVCIMGVTKIEANETVAYSNNIGTSADAQATVITDKTETSAYVCGQVIDGVTNAGEYAVAFVNCAGLMQWE